MTWFTGSRGRRRERHVAVERGVLVARGGLDRGDDLPRDAQLGEVAERRLAVGPEVPDRLVKPDEAFLDEVLGVAADQEVRRCFQADERVIAADQAVVGIGASLFGKRYEIPILKLYLNLRFGWRQLSHEHVLPGPAGAWSRGAHLPRRRFTLKRTP